jgi:hypothetical protein
MQEPPFELLQILARDWKVIFANEVFLVFVPPHSPRAAIDSPHIATFYKKLELIRLNLRPHCKKNPKTGLLIQATHAPAMLDQTLAHLSCFDLPIFVMDMSNHRTHCNDYKKICSQSQSTVKIHLLSAQPRPLLSASLDDLVRENFVWISCFQDNVRARADLILALARFQNPSTHPFLSGHWEDSHGQKKSRNRDGYTLIETEFLSQIHRHFHQSLWQKNPQTLLSSLMPRGFLKKTPYWALPGLVTMAS